MAGDIDAALDTLSDDAWYEFQPCGLRIVGKEAIRVAYERIHATFHPRYLKMKPLQNTAHGDLVMVAEGSSDFLCLDNVSRTVRHCAIVQFKPSGLIFGERVYMSAKMNAALEDSLGFDFDKYPGASRLP